MAVSISLNTNFRERCTRSPVDFGYWWCRSKKESAAHERSSRNNCAEKLGVGE